jgi:hypothetical protein
MPLDGDQELWLEREYSDTRGIPCAPIIEPTGNTDRVINFASAHAVGDDYRETAEKLDILDERFDCDLLPKFERVFDLLKLT